MTKLGRPLVKLITFGGGGNDYHRAAKRLIDQSKAFSAIDLGKTYTDIDLPLTYHKLFDGLTDKYVTGYGLYSWKPYLIYDELNKLAPNDILIYIDAGCELNKRGVRRFDDYLSHTSKNDILLFELPHPNRHWTKNHPKLLGYPEHYFRNQLASGIIFLKNNERTKRLIKAWLDLCAYKNGALLKEPEDNEIQPPGFIKHRHDQSCLSVCAYLYNVIALPDETWFSNWREGQNYPILAFRNRTGVSILKEKLKINIFKEIKLHLKNK